MPVITKLCYTTPQLSSRGSGCRDNVGALFDLTTLLRSGTTINLTFLRKFLSETVPAIYSVEEKKEVILLCKVFSHMMHRKKEYAYR